MQLKGLVRFFTIALILICLYQLSFTWIVKSHEGTMEAKAGKWLNANYPKPEVKYPADKALQSAYSDTLKEIEKEHLQHLLDSSKDAKVGPLGLTTYRSAKEKELMLGLDLQGGMSVTMEVGLDGLIRSLANNSKDPAFNKALDSAVARKANSGKDLISLFSEEFQKNASGAKLAPFFASKSNSKIKFDASDATVLNYLRAEATTAFNNTYRILRTRIDRFGVASPTINPDPAKGIITIELAGINDPERVRHYLQSTANLQFFELYNIAEVYEPYAAAEKALSEYLKGTKATTADTTATATAYAAADTTAVAKADTASTGTLSDIDSKAGAATAKTDTSKVKPEDAPLSTSIALAQPQRAQNGSVQYPANIGYVMLKDSGVVGKYLRMDIVKNKFPSNLQFMYGKIDSDDPKMRNVVLLYAVKTLDNGNARLEGENVSDARQDYDDKGRIAIKMAMDPIGTKIWADMTSKNIGKPIAIVLDNTVYSAPFVNTAIPNGQSEISGSYSLTEAQDMADILQSGKLPAPAKIVQEQIIGPTLGNAAVKGGALSFGISFLVIFALMLLYYNTAGWVANIALILNLLFTIGILSALGFTLTAPGIAGLVLTIGLAVDTNVIIFERIKEELTRGKGYQNAVTDGYKRSYAPVLDAHVTTLLTAIILAYFGLGPVLGFATTQIIGILLSLFCGIMVSRLISDIYTNKNRHFKYFTGVSQKVFKHAAYKFVEYRKVAYGISIVVALLGIGSFFYGFDYGVEFEGGRSYTVMFDKVPNQQVVSDDLKEVFGEYPVIKTVDKANQLNITTAYKIHETGNNVDSSVEQTLFRGLSKHLPAGITYSEFASKYKQSSQTVLPTISDDLKQGATKATVLAIIAICLYIFIRFRDWRFSVGTVVALLHDVFVTLAVFSFLRKVVPFPLEIDQHFIAAILTVIGFSMNDTVIVYDRIREDVKLMKGEAKDVVINRAINQTLSRTLMTSLTVFLTILILFIFGGEVTRGFSFAMLIGVITGTYSSIFVAAPILLDLAKNKPLGKSEEVKVQTEKAS
ncbi:SecD/SecF fusion protein [Filimonas zeae]|uniref:Multifunctional fusion protein n=1 Tax=Filimonas zeae TaxID=1737353 RepID=A0A917IW28_9BACT|nr:protein translocase subunit SecDF [Filimonas zeae]MDR6339029.1 SecD/SecF fusion protein [Filimonas zeae]GGH65446.1 protein translocase subunit SecDF [Filimonas zeae]